VALIVIGARGQAGNAAGLLQSELVPQAGQNTFLPWLAAILIIGVAGYIKPVKPFSDAFIGLILLSLFLKDGQGFFSQFQAALGTQPSKTTTSSSSSSSSAPQVTGSGVVAGGADSLGGQLAQSVANMNQAASGGSTGQGGAGVDVLPGGSIAVPGFNGIGSLPISTVGG
jgi:hypothetical protein